MTQRSGALFCASYVKIGRFLVTVLTRINATPNLNRGIQRSIEDYKKKTRCVIFTIQTIMILSQQRQRNETFAN